MFGQEGAERDLPAVDNTQKANGGTHVELGLICQKQSTAYDFKAALDECNKARFRIRNKKAPGKTVTTQPTQITQTLPDEDTTQTQPLFGPNPGVLTREASRLATNPTNAPVITIEADDTGDG